MQIILGGTGNVGSAVARALLKRREPVLIVTRDRSRAEGLRRDGIISRRWCNQAIVSRMTGSPHPNAS